MKFAAVFSSLLVAASAAVIPRDNGLDTFTLQAQKVAPKPLPSFGDLQWLGSGIQSVGGPLGWFNSTHTQLKVFIQYNATEGIAFDSTQTARTVYLRPEGEDGLSEAVLGNPDMEANADQMRSTNFTINPTMVNPGETHYLFGYLKQYFHAWTACPSTEGDGWQLYFGKRNGGSKRGCTDPFSLEVFYTSGKQ
ncbi:hypothetical protein FN846DRAFT_670587 [Sphaerosporella brunnea]|uniref:Uncharacterized protein n=1 Tax=Sphaerosporella brunnea TaxID=1250544 RepID=A0A5J5F9N9_9PEZI|nr:hypothetical protein FN846DRAFT_670587 [Sphaerosporella brunnea]